jgi:hypothetical protein
MTIAKQLGSSANTVWAALLRLGRVSPMKRLLQGWPPIIRPGAPFSAVRPPTFASSSMIVAHAALSPWRWLTIRIALILVRRVTPMSEH